MKISWQKLNEYEMRVKLDGFSIGEVKCNPVSGNWIIKPNFMFSGRKNSVLKQKFDSSYKAGKLLVELYKKENSRWDDDRNILEDTLELDMRDLWKRLKP